MSHKKCARDFGVVLFLMGFLALFPGLTQESYFLGLFKVNFSTNLLHLITGLVAFLLSRTSIRACKIAFQVFGLLYGTIAVLGFGYGDRNILGFLANNMAMTWVHLSMGLLSLYLGFLYNNSHNQ